VVIAGLMIVLVDKFVLAPLVIVIQDKVVGREILVLNVHNMMNIIVRVHRYKAVVIG
jgi:hypothetical protein